MEEKKEEREKETKWDRKGRKREEVGKCEWSEKNQNKKKEKGKEEEKQKNTKKNRKYKEKQNKDHKRGKKKKEIKSEIDIINLMWVWVSTHHLFSIHFVKIVITEITN